MLQYYQYEHQYSIRLFAFFFKFNQVPFLIEMANLSSWSILKRQNENQHECKYKEEALLIVWYILDTKRIVEKIIYTNFKIKSTSQI